MARVLPDGYDIVVWKLDEAGPTFNNSSTSALPSAPGAGATLSAVNTVHTQRHGILGNCVGFPGSTPSTRNRIEGSSTFEPTFPITVSCWILLKSYNTTGGDNYGAIIAKSYVTSSWGSPYTAFDIYMNNTQDGQWLAQITTGSASRSSNVSFSANNRIPLGIWSHIGITYDGAVFKAFLNGNQVLSTAITGAIDYGNHGNWFCGAIPYTSGTKQEPSMMIQDIRVAKIARSPKYFKDVYNGISLETGANASITKYYKLRVYDLGCSTPTPVTWVDTEVSLTNAPVFPCTGPYSSIEILDTWYS